jgi:hypothetical protein
MVALPASGHHRALRPADDRTPGTPTSATGVRNAQRCDAECSHRTASACISRLRRRTCPCLGVCPCRAGRAVCDRQAKELSKPHRNVTPSQAERSSPGLGVIGRSHPTTASVSASRHRDRSRQHGRKRIKSTKSAPTHGHALTKDAAGVRRFSMPDGASPGESSRPHGRMLI